MRLKNTIRNATVAFAGQIVFQILHFISRIIFVRLLGVEYLGANSLFNDILSMLSVAELGIGTAIVFAMYKPMAEENYEKLHQLADFYRNAYRIIGTIMIVAGVALIPFLRFLISAEDAGNVKNLEVIYLLVLTNSVVTYFFSYKTTLLTVAQEAYIESFSSTCFRLIQTVGQIIILLLTHNYLLYLSVQVICTVAHNVVVSSIAARRFPFVNQRVKESLPGEERKQLFKNVRALIMHRLGNFFVNGTDNILITKFLGLAVSGIYSNYRTLIVTVNSFTNILFNAMTASIGNLNATADREVTRKVFEKINFMTFWISTFTSVCFLCLFNPFITISYGKDLMLPFSTVCVIVLNYYLTLLRQPVLVFRNALGLYWYDRFKPIVESVINIVASLILLQYIGLAGVLVGTAISTLGVVLWVEPRILYKFGFETPVRLYFGKYIEYFLVCLINCALCFMLCTWLPWTSEITNFIFRILLCLLAPNMVLWLLYHKKEEYRYFIDLIVSKLRNKYGAER